MTISFAQRHDPDDVACRELTSKISLLGALCLIVMDKLFPQAITGDRLAYRFKVSDKRKTLDPVLADLWTYGYASHTGDDNWRITDTGRQSITSIIASDATPLALAASTAAFLPAAQPALMQIVDNSPNLVDNSAGENLRTDLSSNRSMIDQNLDRSLIDQEEEERREKIAWLDRHAVTGDKRKLALASTCTAAHLDAWLTHWTREGKTSKGEPFRSKYGPLNYALTCSINGDIPPMPADDHASFPNASIGNPVPAPQPETFSEPEQPAAPPIIDHPSLSKPIGPVSTMTPVKVWQAAQGELQLQMTRVTFDTWVKRTSPVEYTNNTLTVAVPNDYTREWWDTRLKTTAQRIVTGIVGQHIDVRFTVWRSS